MAKITKCSELLDIIKELSPSIEPTFKDAQWFIAYKLADQMIQDMGRKEFAMYFTGDSTIEPLLYIEDIDEELEFMEYTKTELKRELRRFGYTKKFTKQP